jgi:hypothetical protein
MLIKIGEKKSIIIKYIGINKSHDSRSKIIRIVRPYDRVIIL